MIDPRHGWNASYKPHFLGFVMSFLLIVAVYRIVMDHELRDALLVTTVVVFTVLSALIQLVFFLHLGMESKPHWFMMTFLFSALVIVIVIGGSLWIMNNINYDLMPSMKP
jgi:cytochrome o ubiquinol oxidase operon protein cyoD